MVLGTGSRRCAEFEGAHPGLGGLIDVMDIKSEGIPLKAHKRKSQMAPGPVGAEACTGECASQI